MKPRLLALLALLFFACGAAYKASSSRMNAIAARRSPLPRPVPIPRVLNIKSVKITTRIEAQVATTRVEQDFENETPYRVIGGFWSRPALLEQTLDYTIAPL